MIDVLGPTPAMQEWIRLNQHHVDGMKEGESRHFVDHRGHPYTATVTSGVFYLTDHTVISADEVDAHAREELAKQNQRDEMLRAILKSLGWTVSSLSKDSLSAHRSESKP